MFINMYRCYQALLYTIKPVENLINSKYMLKKSIYLQEHLLKQKKRQIQEDLFIANLDCFYTFELGRVHPPLSPSLVRGYTTG